MTASTRRRSRSACHNVTPMPPMNAMARTASRSSREPGNVTTPTLGMPALIERPRTEARWPTPRCDSSRSLGSTGVAAPSHPLARRPPLPFPRPPRAPRTCPHARSRHWPSPSREGILRWPCPEDRGAPASTTRRPGIGTSSPVRHSHPLTVPVEPLAGDPLVSLPIGTCGPLDHAGREVRGRRLVIPPARIEPVPDVLLVERRLWGAGRVTVRRPETRRVRCEHLVHQDQIAAGEPELELRVRHDDAALTRDLRPSLVQTNSQLAEVLGKALTHQVRGLFERKRQVVPFRRLRGGREDGLWQPIGLTQTRREGHPAHVTLGQVLLEPRPGQVPPGHALDRDHLRPADEHGPAGE